MSRVYCYFMVYCYYRHDSRDLEDWCDLAMLNHPGIPIGGITDIFVKIYLHLADILWISSFRLAWQRRLKRKCKV